jgi:nitrite reductase/ring-hydroxylating ferredoxin subunit
MISIPNVSHMFNQIDINGVIYDDFKKYFKEEEVNPIFGIKVCILKDIPKNIVIFRQSDRVVGWLNLCTGYITWIEDWKIKIGGTIYADKI